MNVKTILFPSDFSSKADEAFDFATAMAQQNGAKLLVVHVEEPPLVYGDGSFYYGIPDPDEGSLREMLGKLQPHPAGIPCEHFLLKGSPAAAIIDFAKEKGVDLIVMSSHGRTGLGRLLMGSVAELVMRRAECPILIVKPGVTAAQAKTLTATK
jgi:nucleotide-binding universal stress UspA family protein